MALINLSRILLGVCILFSMMTVASAKDTWTEAKSPHFTVITNASAKQAQRTARVLEQFRALIETIFPAMNPKSESALVVIATRDGNSLKQFLTKEMLKKGNVQPSGYFSSGIEQQFVALRIDAPDEQGFHVAYHEYVHLLQRNMPSMPLWVNEGMAEFFGYANISDGKSGLGLASPEQLDVLNNSPIIPLNTLFAVNQDSPYYRQQGKAGVFYAQSWALFHYLMVGDKRAHYKKLFEFLDMLQNNVPEQEAIGRTLGDLRTLEQKLTEYIRLRAFYSFEIPMKLNIKENEYSTRVLSNTEFLALRGGIYVNIDRLDEAKADLDQALQLDPRSAAANEAMGMLFLRKQDYVQAQKYFIAATDLNSSSFIAQYYAAQAMYEKSDTVDLGAVENHLRKALEINPSFIPAYRMLYQVLRDQESKYPEALEIAQKAAALEPAQMDHKINICRILMAMGKIDEAANLSRNLHTMARTESDRAQVESIISWIKRRQDEVLEAKRYSEMQRELTIKRKTQLQAEAQHAIDKEIDERSSDTVIAPKTGPAGHVRGIIRTLKCDYPAIMDMILDSNGKLLKLRAQNYYKVAYGAVGEPGRNNFQPCKELEGKQVLIDFFGVADQEFSGLIQSVTIEK